MIPDTAISASSTLSANTPTKNARLNYAVSDSWCASTADTDPYLQISLYVPYVFCAIETQGNSKNENMVTSYSVQISYGGSVWYDYKVEDSVKVND